MCVCFNPDGSEVAAATLNGNISFFDVKTSDEVGSIDGRSDLGAGRSDLDVITPKTKLKAR